MFLEGTNPHVTSLSASTLRDLALHCAVQVVLLMLSQSPCAGDILIHCSLHLWAIFIQYLPGCKQISFPFVHCTKFAPECVRYKYEHISKNCKFNVPRKSNFLAKPFIHLIIHNFQPQFELRGINWDTFCKINFWDLFYKM